MKYTVRNAQMEDFPRIEEIYVFARKYMAENGNPSQWGKTNPPRERLLQDIEEQKLYVVEDRAGIHGVFFYMIGEDPTYGVIVGGNWTQDGVYGTIHRIAGDGSGGVLRTAVEFARTQCPYVRIDTHENNHTMHAGLQKLGFRKCGMIYIADGSERIAYDYC